MKNELVAPFYDDSIRTEFDAVMARSGIVVLPDLYEGTLANYAEMRRLAALLRLARDAESEPSNIFSLSVVMRGI